MNDVLNRNNRRIWGSQKPNVLFEYVRDFSKVTIQCMLMEDRMNRPNFFVERTKIGNVYLHMPEEYYFY